MKSFYELFKNNGSYIIFGIIGAIAGFMEINRPEYIVKTKMQKVSIWLGYIMIALFGTKGAVYLIESTIYYISLKSIQIPPETQNLICIVLALSWKQLVPTLSIILKQFVNINWKDILLAIINSKKK